MMRIASRLSLLSLLLAAPAAAYIDPTTGGMLIQMLLAGLAGVGMVVGMFWARIKGFLLGMFCRNKPRNDD